MVVNLSSPSNNYLIRTDTLIQYYEDVRKFGVLTREESEALFEIYKDKESSDEERAYARETIINANQRFIIAIAKKYATDDNVLDVINEANIGLMEAIDKFDASVGVSFMTFAVHYIRRNINNYLINYKELVKQSGKSKTYHVISKATNKFMQRELRQPTEEELKDLIKEEYGVDINSTLDVIDCRTLSIDNSFAEEDDRNDCVLSEYNTKSASLNDCEVSQEKDYATFITKSLLGKLKPKEAEVISLLFGVNEYRPLEIQEVAERTGYTTERIRQMKTEILNKLRKEYKSMVL